MTNDMVLRLMEEEKRLKEQVDLIETSYRSPKIDVEKLLKEGYISADDYRAMKLSAEN